MSIICPTVLAETEAEYGTQMQKIGPFAKRIQIDLMDGHFASPRSVELEKIWWPAGVIADIHLMYADPFSELEKLLRIKPNMVIVHVETMVHHMHFAAELHKEGIKAGLAILPDTPVTNIEQILHSFDHLLIFSGDLGHFGGQADLGLIEKASEAKAHHEELEVGWDGGVKPENARALIAGGIDVLNVGGFIQNAEDPLVAYQTLAALVK